LNGRDKGEQEAGKTERTPNAKEWWKVRGGNCHVRLKHVARKKEDMKNLRTPRERDRTIKKNSSWPRLKFSVTRRAEGRKKKGGQKKVKC